MKLSKTIPIIWILFISVLFAKAKEAIPNFTWTVLWENRLEYTHKVYLANLDHNSVFITSMNNSATTFNLNTGTTIWNYKKEGNKHSLFNEPIVINNIAYFGNSKGNYYALDLMEKSSLFEIVSLEKGDRKICSQPNAGASSKNTLIIGGARKYKSRIQGLHLKTGKVMWDIKIPESEIKSKPAYNEKCAFFLIGKRLIAIDYEGKIQWDFNCLDYAGSLHTFPVLNSNRLYFCSRNFIYALNATTGEQVWNRDSIVTSFTTPLITDGKLLVHNSGNTMYCLNTSKGETIWKTRLPDNGLISQSQPILFRNCVTFIYTVIDPIDGDKSFLYMLNKTNGKIIYSKLLNKNEKYSGLQLFPKNDILLIQSLIKDKKGKHILLRAIQL